MTRLTPDLSDILQETNKSIALLKPDTDSSFHISSTVSVGLSCTPNTDNNVDGDYNEEGEIAHKYNTRSRKKVSTASLKLKITPAKPIAGSAARDTAVKRRNRNRIAAAKCRYRKKQWQDGLERKRIDLERQSMALHSESEELLEEVAQLKNFLMAHGACGDTKINDWICNQVDMFVRRVSTAQALMHPASALPVSAAALNEPDEASFPGVH